MPSILDYPGEYNLHVRAILYAFDKGYWFDFNSLCMVTPSGRVVKPKLYGKQRYPCMTINDGTGKKHNVSFLIHKFIGYTLFGMDALKDGVNVRHLDDNPLNLSKENIAIGSSQDNNLDKCPKIRKQVAQNARRSQGVRPHNCVVSDQEAETILRKYLDLKGDRTRAKRGTIKQLQVDHPYSTESVQAICSGHSFKDIYAKVIKERQE